MSNFVDVDDANYKDFPDLSKYGETKGVSNYSLEYFKPMINTLSITDEKIKIKVGEDYPVSIENKDFIFVLAPRVESD